MYVSMSLRDYNCTNRIVEAARSNLLAQDQIEALRRA